MQAQLRSLWTIDGDDPREVKPGDDAFCVSLRAMIGTAGAEGEESFDFDVCSPAWLAAELVSHAVVSGRFLLIVEAWDVERVEKYVRKRVAQATGADWATIAGKLACWSRWEFEDCSG